MPEFMYSESNEVEPVSGIAVGAQMVLRALAEEQPRVRLTAVLVGSHDVLGQGYRVQGVREHAGEGIQKNVIKGRTRSSGERLTARRQIHTDRNGDGLPGKDGAKKLPQRSAANLGALSLSSPKTGSLRPSPGWSSI